MISQKYSEGKGNWLTKPPSGINGCSLWKGFGKLKRLHGNSWKWRSRMARGYMFGKMIGLQLLPFLLFFMLFFQSTQEWYGEWILNSREQLHCLGSSWQPYDWEREISAFFQRLDVIKLENGKYEWEKLQYLHDITYETVYRKDGCLFSRVPWQPMTADDNQEMTYNDSQETSISEMAQIPPMVSRGLSVWFG